MIVAVSDVHLGWKDKGKQEKFSQFLDKCNSPEIDHFVLMGDIFDFWRRTNRNIFTYDESENMVCRLLKTEGQIAEIRRIVKTNEEILEKLAGLQAKNIHYLVGNHDYYIHRLFRRHPERYPFQVAKSVTLSEGGQGYHFTHGYDLDVFATMESLMSIDQYEKLSECLCFLTDTTGWLASSIWGVTEKIGELTGKIKMLQEPPEKRGPDIDLIRAFADSRAPCLFLGLHPKDVLVYGHTHVPYPANITADTHSINTGTWDTGSTHPYTYLKISGKTAGLYCFHGEDVV